MENFMIDGTSSTPSIKIDTQTKTFEISGVSLPENPQEFYGQIIERLNRYNENELTIICDLVYCNSASTKYFLSMLKTIIASVNNIKIIWIYDEDDDDIKDLGGDLRLVVNCKFELKVRQE